VRVNRKGLDCGGLDGHTTPVALALDQIGWSVRLTLQLQVPLKQAGPSGKQA
jgi:hypothetical protein